MISHIHSVRKGKKWKNKRQKEDGRLLRLKKLTHDTDFQRKLHLKDKTHLNCAASGIVGALTAEMIKNPKDERELKEKRGSKPIGNPPVDPDCANKRFVMMMTLIRVVGTPKRCCKK
nr:hypothetical protein [Tanacetum cinerariifolium]